MFREYKHKQYNGVKVGVVKVILMIYAIAVAYFVF